MPRIAANGHQFTHRHPFRWRQLLRQRYHQEVCAARQYDRAAQSAGDACLSQMFRDLSRDETRHARQLMALLEQTVARPQSSALLVIACETLQDTAGVLKETQREILLLTLVEKLRGIIPPRMVLAQIPMRTRSARAVRLPTRYCADPLSSLPTTS